MFKTFAFAATALTLASGSAFAAPSDDARNWDGAAQPVPDFEVDQRINW